jgi:hypothetical protein
MIFTAETHSNPPALARVERVTWQRIPISADELRGVLIGLIPPDPGCGGPHEMDPAKAESTTQSSTWKHLRQHTSAHHEDPLNVGQFVEASRPGRANHTDAGSSPAAGVGGNSTISSQ